MMLTTNTFVLGDLLVEVPILNFLEVKSKCPQHHFSGEACIEAEVCVCMDCKKQFFLPVWRKRINYVDREIHFTICALGYIATNLHK